MMHALNEMCVAATKNTEATEISLTHYINHFASNPDAEIIYRKSDILLNVNSDAAYLVA